MKYSGVVTIANPIFQEYLDFIFKSFGGSLSPMDWLEMDMSMSKTEMLILLLLEREKGMKVSDVGRRMGMALSTTTSMIDRLENRELVERTRSTEDRRVVMVRLTEEGEKLCARIGDKAEAMLTAMWQKVAAKLTDEEIELLKKIYYKMTRA